MSFYRDGFLVREAWRHLREHAGERRGRKIKIDGDRAFRNFVELEARAVVATGGNLSAFLADRRLRIVLRPDVSPRGERLRETDRHRLRKLHQIGQTEYHFWRDMRCRDGVASRTMLRDQTGEPHPIYYDMRRILEDRVAELRACDKALFFLSLIPDREPALAEFPREVTGITRP